ncbi:MAG: glycosyltransferase family 2 protein [Syntrophaceae bacterium]|nr:glycosyltransferase family 2 protein [Syntrophaceae bacterium]
MPFLTVAVCTRNRSEKTRNAVESILSNSFQDYELLVVDQSTEGATGAVMDGYDDKRIRYIHTDTVGLSRSRNVAIRESKAEIIVFTDDDCICDRDWLGSIAAEYDQDPNMMGVYGRVLPFGDGREGMVCQCLIDSMERRIVNKPIIPYNVLGHGNNMSFRKDVFRKVGLYIESLGAGTWMKGGEDTDLTYRVLRSRMKVCYSPAPLVYHDNWLTREKSAALECDYILASVAVFMKYALKLDRVAPSYLDERGREIIYRVYWQIKHSNKADLKFALKRLKYYSVGLLMGVRFLFVAAPGL